MIGTRPAFSGFSAGDIEAERAFYADTLGVTVEDGNGSLMLNLANGQRVFIYPKPNHEPATFTVLNFEVDDINAAVDELSGKGVTVRALRGPGAGRARDRARQRRPHDRLVQGPGRQHPVGAPGRLTAPPLRFLPIPKFATVSRKRPRAEGLRDCICPRCPVSEAAGRSPDMREKLLCCPPAG